MQSMSSPARRAALAFSFGFAALVAACGGGGGGGSDVPESPPPAPAPGPGSPAPGPGPAPAPLNGDFAGTLYFEGPGSSLAFDIATGLTQALRTQSSALMPSRAADHFTFTGDSPADPVDTDRLSITGADGIVQSSFDVEDGLRDAGALSPDGTRVAANWSRLGDATLTNPTVFDLTGHVLQRYPGYTDYAWMPDGGLVLAKGDSIWRVAPDLGTPQLVQTFPNDAPGFLAPSPDGTRLAFVLGSRDLLQNHVWLMNMDGSGAHQLTTSSANEDGAGWSDDGRFLALRQGIAYGGLQGGIPGVPCPQLWIVPSDATGLVPLDATNSSTPARLLRQVNPDGTTQDGVCAFGVPAWRGAPPTLPASNGTSFSGAGVNAGLAGHLWLDDAFQDVVFDVSTGQASAQYADATGDVTSLSPAGDEIVVSSLETDSHDLSANSLRIVGLDGTTHAYFEKPEFLSGTPQLSPDGQSIAVQWNADALGDPAGKDIVTVFGRDGTVKQRIHGYQGWSWLADGRLLVNSGNEVDVVDADFRTLTKLAVFPDAVSDVVGSPDLTHLAFVMGSHVWTSQLDGSVPAQLTVSGGYESTPAWSPDGRAIALRLHPELGTCPVVHVVPADGQRVFVGQAGVGSSALALTVTDRGTTGSICSFSRLAWVD